MSSLDERLGIFVLGWLIGYIFGCFRKFDRSIREIKSTVEEVDNIVKQSVPHRNEEGFMRRPVVADAMMIITLIIVALAAFYTQKVNNDVQHAQDRIDRVTACNQVFLAKTISALNERTEYTSDQAAKNVELQKAQSTFLRIIIGPPPPTDEDTRVALADYFETLTEFVEISAEQSAKVRNNPYPTEQELNSCLGE